MGLDSSIEAFMLERSCAYVPDELAKDIFSAYSIQSFIVAGGVFCDLYPVRDVDLFETKTGDFSSFRRLPHIENNLVKDEGGKAFTVKIKYDRNAEYNFCRVCYCSLEGLINSFDFAHCQAGVKLQLFNGRVLREVYYTDDFSKSTLTKSTWYTGSEYPLSSLVRLCKFYSYGLFKDRNDFKINFMLVVNDFLDRGFVDEEDFSEQMDGFYDNDFGVNSVMERLKDRMFNLCLKRNMFDKRG